jgi:hypothetical protein
MQGLSKWKACVVQGLWRRMWKGTASAVAPASRYFRGFSPWGDQPYFTATPHG